MLSIIFDCKIILSKVHYLFSKKISKKITNFASIMNGFLQLVVAQPDVKKRVSERKPSPDMRLRYASLNDTDRQQLEREMDALFDFFGRRDALEYAMPTLYAILQDTWRNDGSAYPGRHLPIKDLRVKNAWRYQCLRIMDEILYTASRALSDSEMVVAIKALARQNYGIEPQALGVATLKKLYPSLSDLITSTVTHGQRKKYMTSVYAPGVLGHAYAEPRHMAFAIDITLDEVALIENDVKKAVRNYFNGDWEEFEQNYPLIAMMGRLTETVLDPKSDLTCKLKYDTPLHTVDYMPYDHFGLRRKISEAIEQGRPVAAQMPHGVAMVMPRELRSHNGRWALIAVVPSTGAVRVFQPQELDVDYDEPATPAGDILAGCEDHIIGMSPLWDDEPCNISLTLTQPASWTSGSKETSGVMNFHNTLFAPLATPDKYGRVSFSAYLNDDLFEELMRMDRNCHIRKIEPADLFEKYKEYWQKAMGGAYVSYDQRPAHAKFVKMPRR